MASYGSYGSNRGPPRGRGGPRGPAGPRGRPILTPEQEALVDRLPTTIYVSPIELPFSQKQAENAFASLGKVRGAATSTMASGQGCARIEFHKATTAYKAVQQSEKFKVGSGKPPTIEWSDFDVQGRPLPIPCDNLVFRNPPSAWYNVHDCNQVLTKVKKVMRVGTDKMLIMFESVVDALENWEKHSDTVLPGCKQQVQISFAVANSPYAPNPIINHMGLGKGPSPSEPSTQAPHSHSSSGHHESRSEREREARSDRDREGRRDRERGEERRSDRDRDGYSRSSRRDDRDREYGSRREKSQPRTTVVVPPPASGPSPAELVHIQDQVRAMLNVQAPEPSATVSFTGLHANMSELFVFNVCSIFGAIHKVESSNGAARIHFSRRSDAETCISRLNGTKVGENPWALVLEAPVPQQPAYQPPMQQGAPAPAAAYTGYGY